tara:strand:+ start:277 stop:510 length:234 start_codon:yes stop_codon:yes gene_type:complete
MSKVTVSYEFDAYEEREELRNLINYQDAASILLEIDQKIRRKLKYGDDKWLEVEEEIGILDFLEELRTDIFSSGVLN